MSRDSNLCGCCFPVVDNGSYAFGGMLEAGRIGSATNNLGFMYELDAIAACVVGGVSFSGGVGTVIGVVTGVIIFTVITLHRLNPSANHRCHYRPDAGYLPDLKAD